jgi:hypothetical protein
MTTVISLTIDGHAFSIDPHDIAFFPVEYGSDICVSGIGIGGVGPFYSDTDWLASLPTTHFFLFLFINAFFQAGDVFLKNVYFSTDESTDQISFAKPTN